MRGPVSLRAVHPADWLRIPVSGVIILFSLGTAETITFAIATAHGVFSVLWVIVQALRLVDQGRHPRLAYVPASLDILAESILVLFSGVFSPYAIGYAAMTAVSSLNTRVRQGEFVMAASIASYGVLLCGHALGMTAPFELLRQGTQLGLPFAAATWLFFATVIFATHKVVHSLTGQNERAVADLRRAQTYMERELEMAREIQRHLMPHTPPQIEGAAIYSRYIALSQVGGDYLDFLLGEKRVGILVADAAGHGVPAALVATMAKMALDGLHASMDSPPALLRGLNAALLDRTNQTFLTGLYAVFNTETRELRYCMAGGPPPFLLQPGRPARQLPGRGSLLAILPEMKLQEQRILLQPGDAVVFVTDGILECRDAKGADMTEEQLTSLLSGLSGAAPADIVPLLIRELRKFVGSRGFEDDVTLVVLAA